MNVNEFPSNEELCKKLFLLSSVLDHQCTKLSKIVKKLEIEYESESESEDENESEDIVAIKWKKLENIYKKDFGLDINSIKLGCEKKIFIKWIEDHFECNWYWSNYGKKWKLQHIIPDCCFGDFHNFHNITASPIDLCSEGEGQFNLFYYMVQQAENFIQKINPSPINNKRKNFI